ncbi:MAG: hypothetical protein F6K31_30240 [Symploca sp. SIO2G7]|nr:hypothetical protein [Symploca sp. SIO2G7]
MSDAKSWEAMKLPELKKRVWRTWCHINSWKGELTSPPESYVAEVKGFGDRRYKKTWIKALARFEAMFTYETCLDAWALISISFNFTPGHRNYEYRHEILDEFLMYPDGLEMIKDGLEQVFSTDCSPQERENAHGFFKLLEERESEHRGIGSAVGFNRELAGAGTAA